MDSLAVAYEPGIASVDTVPGSIVAVEGNAESIDRRMPVDINCCSNYPEPEIRKKC